MTRPLALAPIALIAACGAPADDARDSHADPLELAAEAERLGASPIGPHALDLEMTQGHTFEDHVEVAPGVYLLEEVVNSGDIMVAPTDEESPLLKTDAEDAERSARFLDYTCREYDSDGYRDRTRRGSLWGGNPKWATNLEVFSIDEVVPGRTVQTSGLELRAYTEAPVSVDFILYFAYIEIDGRYAGFVYNYGLSDSFTDAYALITTSCDSGDSLDVDVYTVHFAYGRGHTIATQYSLYASVPCCEPAF